MAWVGGKYGPIRQDRGGITSMEYAIILGAVAGGILVATLTLGGTIANELNEAAECVRTQDPCD